MSAPISWIAELDIKPGQEPAFRALTDEMVELTEAEPGTLIYQRFVGGDGSRVMVLERYSDCRAAVDHLNAFREHFGTRFSALVERKRFVVLGEADEALKRALDGFNAEYMGTLAGFSRT